LEVPVVPLDGFLKRRKPLAALRQVFFRQKFYQVAVLPCLLARIQRQVKEVRREYTIALLRYVFKAGIANRLGSVDPPPDKIAR